MWPPLCVGAKMFCTMSNESRMSSKRHPCQSFESSTWMLKSPEMMTSLLKSGDGFEECGDFVEELVRHLITSGSINHHLGEDVRCRRK